MIQASSIKPEMSVVCSQNGLFGVVDHMEGGDTIKLKKDSKGQHHFIPLSWVKSLDSKVHIDRPGAQAMKEWADNAPTKAAKSDSRSDGHVDSKANGNGKGSPGAAPEMKAAMPAPSAPAPSSPMKTEKAPKATPTTRH